MSNPDPKPEGHHSSKVITNLGYIELPKDVGEAGSKGWMSHEGFRDKFIRKTKENPFVPLGLGLTIAALSYGLWQLKTGDRVMSQKMMRVRVAAQAFTVVALVTGVLYQSNKPRRRDD